MTTTNTEKCFIRLGDRDYELGSQAHLDAIEAIHNAKCAELQKQNDAQAGRLDAAEKAVKDAQEELEEERKKSRDADKESEKTLAARVKSRVRLVMKALRLFGEDDESEKNEDEDDKKLDSLCEMTERELHLKAIRKADPDFRADGKSDDYIAGKFEGAVAFLSNDKGVNGVVRAIEESKRHFDSHGRSGGEHQVTKARRENLERMRKLANGGGAR